MRVRHRIYQRVLTVIVFSLGLCFGIYLVKNMNEYFIERAGIISEYYFRQIPYRNFDEVRLLKYLLGKRMKWAVLLIGASFLGLLDFCIYCMSGWAGFSLGYLGCIAVLKFGISGLEIIAFSLMPQIVFYIWGTERLRKSVCFKSYCRSLGIFISGVLSECYINQWILKWIGKWISIK